MLNLTVIILINNITIKICGCFFNCKFLNRILCIHINMYIKKFKANNSTKSQLHQPPQDNSCSAHQQPKIIAV